MRFWFAAVVSAFAVTACVLPSAEVDENFLTGGAGGSAPRGGAAGTGGAGGLAGRGGSAGKAAIAGNAGAGIDPREDACINYCSLYFQACETHEKNTYDNIMDCFTTCATAGWPFGSDVDEANSLQCRQTHAGFAVAGMPELHCFHSAELPTMGKCEP
jgi:hypothetical protein